MGFFFIGFSSSATAGNDNPGNLSGSDAAYNGYGAAAADATEASKQLIYVGRLVTTADTDIQHAEIGEFMAELRYAMIAVHNDSGVSLAATDAIETAVIITPSERQLQD